MPHQCVHCGKIIGIDSREILEGCNTCHGKFFFYIKDEQIAKLKQAAEQTVQQTVEAAVPEFSKMNKTQVEKDVREILEIEDDEKPVILDLESVKVLSPGKFEIDLVSLINRRPIVFKLEEGKYIIDLESSMPGKI